MPQIGTGPALPPKLRMRIPRDELHKCTLEALLRFAVFLEAPLYEKCSPGLRKHYLVNAIERIEKAMWLGRKHPYKKG